MNAKSFGVIPYLACPLDGLPFMAGHDDVQKQLHCPDGHCFDIARQGYVNLLGVQDKRSRDPGDTKAMIAARSRVLDAGLYRLVADTLAGQVCRHLQELPADRQASFTVLDAGCGDGYYLHYCLQAIAGTGLQVKGLGLDISKWAIMAAARRDRHITWLVGSNRNLPVLPESMDVVICGFGFPDFPAFSKALKPDGIVILLDPAAEHLLELRRIIYPFIKPYKANDFSRAAAAGFRVISREQITCKVPATSQQIQDILTMSPHLYKASAEGKAAAFALSALDITLDVNFTVLAR